MSGLFAARERARWRQERRIKDQEELSEMGTQEEQSSGLYSTRNSNDQIHHPEDDDNVTKDTFSRLRDAKKRAHREE